MPQSQFCRCRCLPKRRRLRADHGRIAPLLIRIGGLSDGDRTLDVACGADNPAFALWKITTPLLSQGTSVRYRPFGIFSVERRIRYD